MISGQNQKHIMYFFFPVAKLLSLLKNRKKKKKIQAEFQRKSLPSFWRINYPKKKNFYY